MSGYGGGVEDVSVGIGKLALAFINTARPDIVTKNGNLTKSNIDDPVRNRGGKQLQ
jgi:hypothetical protein